jgi:quinolinate synthase
MLVEEASPMDIVAEIERLKKERKAVILAHNYQLAEVQDVADFNGDSLGLSVEASKTSAELIVFCGVWFMAETAKIISPKKTVIIPDPRAGCPMADMLDAPTLRALKAAHPGAAAMCYVNSSAEVKAECDICCTSSNALTIARDAFEPGREVIFVPDQNLAKYVSRVTGRKFIIHSGFCPTHHKIQAEHVKKARTEHPLAEVIVHPECTLAVIDEADRALSTGQMADYVKKSPGKEFIIGTEEGMIYRLSSDNPGKTFHALLPGAMVCPNMKKITLNKVYEALRDMKEVVEVDAAVAERARLAISRMLEFKSA